MLIYQPMIPWKDKGLIFVSYFCNSAIILWQKNLNLICSEIIAAPQFQWKRNIWKIVKMKILIKYTKDEGKLPSINPTSVGLIDDKVGLIKNNNLPIRSIKPSR